MTDTTRSAPGERLHALDLVRASALLLGIVFHAALPFIPDYELWLVMDDARSWPVAWLAFWLHSFRMATFFLLAGFFGHMVLGRRGTRGFVKDRAGRILAPLLIFWLPVLVLFALALAFAAWLGAIPVPEEPPPPPELTVAGWPLTHLWFLYMLLIVYLATLLLRGAVAAIDRRGALRGAVDRRLSALLRLPFALPLLLAVPVALLLLRHPGWAEWWGIPTPDVGLVPNAAALGSFGLAFAVGWLAHRLDGGLAPLAKQWPLYLPAATAMTVACGVLTSGADFAPQFEGQVRTAYAALYAASIWLWTFGLIGAALRFIRAESPTVRYLADSSYWLYIVHLPLIVALEAVVAKWPLPAEIKLVLIVAAGMAVMLATYRWFVRSTFVGALLNGRRYPRKAVSG
jgi:peptidoglycan/LPS O-acetylase OafA/YrhL